MIKYFLIGTIGVMIGTVLGYLVAFDTPLLNLESKTLPISQLHIFGSRNQTIGFLPYWLSSKAQPDYSKYFTTLTYFGLTIDTDGTILTRTNPQESEPGWLALNSGKVDPFLQTARNHNQSLSLLVFDGDENSIATLLDAPIPHAQNLIKDVAPIMKKYHFDDLNLDIESANVASDEARVHFSQFAREIKSGLDTNHLGTLTIDISPTAFLKKYLIDPSEVTPFTDNIVLMTYDYHYAGSFVTGPISPLTGAGVLSEFDVQKAVELALNIVPAKKLILGIPLYGYEWETVNEATRSAVIPVTGVIASDSRIEKLLSSCATCSAIFDSTDFEPHLVYQDQTSGTFHQIYYTDKKAVEDKLIFAKQSNLGGVAAWALGYESSDVLSPLESYK